MHWVNISLTDNKPNGPIDAHSKSLTVHAAVSSAYAVLCAVRRRYLHPRAAVRHVAVRPGPLGGFDQISELVAGLQPTLQ